MRVRIDGTWYDSNDTEILVSMTEYEKGIIKAMPIDNHVFIAYPDGHLAEHGSFWDFPDQQLEDDCFTACICGILGIRDPLTRMDLYIGMKDNKTWFDWLGVWAENRGLALHMDCDGPPQCKSVAGGESPRGNPRGHSVIWDDGKMIHDPHGSRDGIAGEVREWIWFVKGTA